MTPSSPVPRTSLFHNMMQRYLSNPSVASWLLTRNEHSLESSNALHSAFSYACMYYPPSYVPQGSGPYPLPAPFLDIGDFLLCQRVYDGIAVGTLFNQREEHALSIIRDSMLSNSTLSRRPVTRNFAVDLTVPHMEIVEFAWMDDGCLIIACRRLHNSGSADKHLVLSADMLFYDVIPINCAPDMPLLRMTVVEKPAVCQFCGVRGIDCCRCPPSFKRSDPSSARTDSSFPSKVANTYPGGNSLLGSWTDYTKHIFHCTQSGSFFVHWYKQSDQGMRLFISHPHPISYQFVCGKRKDTLKLASMYVQKMQMCQRALFADSRISTPAQGSQQFPVLLENKVESDEEVKSISTSDLLGISKPLDPLDELDLLSMPTSTTQSQVSASSDDFQQLVNPFDPISPPSVLVQQPVLVTGPDIALDNVSLLSTRISGDSPSLSQRETDIPSIIHFGNNTTDTSGNVPHVMDNVYEAWGEQSQPTKPKSTPKMTLSTTSRELQQYMTVDASGVPTCSECGASFPKRGNLARHVQTVHLKLKPFQCEICHARFGYKNHLKRHQVVHQRGNEFRCNVCNRDFRGQAQLSKHVRQVHQSAQQKNDQCNSSKISCGVCGVSFSQKSNLSRHMQMHDGFRYFCPVCPNKASSFGQRYDLQRHILRKHPGHHTTSMPMLVPERVAAE